MSTDRKVSRGRNVGLRRRRRRRREILISEDGGFQRVFFAFLFVGQREGFSVVSILPYSVTSRWKTLCLIRIGNLNCASITIVFFFFFFLLLLFSSASAAVVWGASLAKVSISSCSVHSISFTREHPLEAEDVWPILQVLSQS